VNSFRIKNNVKHLVNHAEDLNVIYTHTLDHNVLIDPNHMSMAKLDFLYEEWKEWDTESNFAWFGSCDIVTDCWPALKQVITQFVRKCSERTRAIMLKEAYGHAGMPIEGS